MLQAFCRKNARRKEDMKEHVKIERHIGTWYEINDITINGKSYYLMEHETYGEDAPCVAIREDGSLLLEDIWNGIADIRDYLRDNPGKA